jgi:hypothetical protein
MEAEALEATEEEVPELDCAAGEKATLASISGVPKFNTFRMRGVLQGQRVSILIVEESFIPETKLRNKVSGYFTTKLLTRVCTANPQTE